MEKGRVLVADDVKINRRTLKIIYDSKYDILEAENGAQAISVIEEYGEEIDLILLDLQMPVKTGFDVLDYMRENNLLSKIPVIIITASTDQEDELRAFDSGAMELIRKPFVPEIVLRRSENLIELYSSKKSMARELILSRDKLYGIQKNDSLTGLLNMKTFLDAANLVLEENADGIEAYRFIYINITNFKFYNVMQGLAGGDQILQKLAARIRAVKPSALCSRRGQDHFVVMTTDDSETIRENVDAISKDFELTFGQYGMQLKTGVYDLRSRVEKADVACELAKLACDSIRYSTETFCEYTEELRYKMEIQTYAIQHIDEALNKHYIEVYYQPVVRTITGKTCGMEALARWNDPKKGFLSPADFIPSLEKNQLITKLDLYILRETCRKMKQMEAMGKQMLPVSFNFSRIDFIACDLLSEVNHITAEYDISHDLVCIEITETALMDDPERMQQEIVRFREEGYPVWMDDFGSGYSSLNVLKDYQFDEIKLDMKFMTSFDEKSKEIVTAIISMAKRIGVQTLAEGVETKEQYDFLRNIGCEKIQGYFYSRPVASQDIVDIPQMESSQVENGNWRSYYDHISASNLVTEKAHAIFEYDGELYRFMYLNKAYEAALKSTGVSNMSVVMENINSPLSPVNRLYNDFRERCLLGAPVQSVVYSLRDHYIRLNVRRIAEYENKSAYEVEMIDLTGTEAEMTRSKMDKFARRLFGMFDVIFEVDLETGEAEVLRQGEYGYALPREVLDTVHTIEEMNQIMASQIHPDDLEAFWIFADYRTLKERVSQDGHVYITDYFRIRQRNGEYVRKAFRIMYRSDFNNAIYTAYYVPIEDERIIRKVIPDHFILQRIHQEKESDSPDSGLADVTVPQVLGEAKRAERFRRYSDYAEKDFNLQDLQSAHAVIELQNSMLQSIANMYVVMYLCDLESDTFVEIYAMDHVKKLFGAERTASGVLRLVNQYFVAPEFQEEAEIFNDITTLPDRLMGKPILSMDYNATVAGWCRQQFIPVTWDENGRAREVICVEQRIQAEKMQVENLRKLAETDGMTQLLNRSGGVQYINQYLSEGSQGMFCLLDVDNFKRFNDEYGHAAGDKVLQGVSSCMRETFRNVDVLVRIGGDEFVVYALGLLDRKIGEKKIQELSRRIDELCFDEFKERVSISAGTVFSDQYPGEMFDVLFQAADEAMYENKKKKKRTTL